jgi:transcriptional regulator with XRE-family HTH domain
MTKNTLAIMIRAKKLGVLMRGVRLAHSKSIDECARAIGVSNTTYEAYELGNQSPSLPELEMLAYYLGVPLEYFWGQMTTSEDLYTRPTLDQKQVAGLRQRNISDAIRKKRIEAGLSVEDLANKVGIPVGKVENFESGDIPIPLPELDMLALALKSTVKDYQDQQGPIGSWFVQQRLLREFMELPSGLKSFVCKPVNRPYLELAQRLSEMSVEKLRAVAEGLLEITL